MYTRKVLILFTTTLLLSLSKSYADWDVTVPQGTEAKSLGDDRLRELKTDIQDSLDFEGDFPGTSSSTPRFIYTPSTGTTALRPTGNDAPVGRLFINKSSGVIEMSLGSGNWERVDVVGSSMVTSADIAVDIAGPGLSGGGGNPLQVNVDTNTFTITNDTITVTANSIGSTQIADSVNIPTLAVTTQTWAGFGILPILQIQQATITTSSATSLSSFENTNITVSITPKISTSKVLVYVAFQAGIGAGSTASFTLARNGTNLLAASDGFWRGAANYTGHQSYMYLDSPATTSATTYTLQFKSGAGGVTTQVVNETAVIIAVEIAQ